MVATILGISIVVAIASIASIANLDPVRDALGVRASSYRFLDSRPDGTPFRWDPCGEIHYVVHDPPPGTLTTVHEAIARVSEATGIPVVYDGLAVRGTDTYFRMQFQRPFVLGQSRSWEPVLIDWIDTEHFRALAGTRHAAAFGTPWTPEGDLEGTYVSGLVAIDEDLRIPPGFRSRYSLGVVLMHELAHVMGLAHVADGDELMWSPDVPNADPMPDLLQTDWGPGDRVGLREVGRQASCPAA